MEHRKWSIGNIIISIVLLFLCWVSWISPMSVYLKQLDLGVSLALNKMIGENYWTYLWGVLSREFENYLNQLIMILIMSFYIFKSKNKTHTISQLILTYFYLLLGIFMVQQFFVRLLGIERLSPSLAIQNFTNISSVLSGAKYYSTQSFPSGHAFAMFYWATFTTRFLPKKLLTLVWIAAIFFSLPRLFTGSHWISDIIASIFIANFYSQIMISTPMYSVCLNAIEKTIKRFKQP